MIQKNIRGIVVTGTKTYELVDKERYEDLYMKILGRTEDLTVAKSNKPSCAGCPIGCEKSKYGEIGGNVLVHSLVGCAYAEKIYANIGVVFSCLNVLGYDYTHEDIEALPSLIKETLIELS
jgi:aldehyde:ferredoxin oxidoreductase